MPSRDRLVHVGTRRGERLVREFADDVRNARLAAGLSQRSVGTAVGLSPASISRLERGRPPHPDFVVASRVARVVGLDLSVRCFRAAGPLRDEAHVRLVRRFLTELPAMVDRRLEAPIQLPGDQRAWDLLLSIGGQRIGVAVETRLHDVQALLRHEGAKARDDGVAILILVVSDTHANRRALCDARGVIDSELPLGTRQVMAALRRGEAPSASGIAVL